MRSQLPNIPVLFRDIFALLIAVTCTGKPLLCWHSTYWQQVTRSALSLRDKSCCGCATWMEMPPQQFSLVGPTQGLQIFGRKLEFLHPNSLWTGSTQFSWEIRNPTSGIQQVSAVHYYKLEFHLRFTPPALVSRLMALWLWFSSASVLRCFCVWGCHWALHWLPLLPDCCAAETLNNPHEKCFS